MRIKLIIALIFSALTVGCTTIIPQNKQAVKKASKTQTKQPSKRRPANFNVNTKKTVTAPKEVKTEYKELTNDSSGKKLPVFAKTNNLSNAHWQEDRTKLLRCEKAISCIKELIIIDGVMVLLVSIEDRYYHGLKNKDNLITYFNNDVKIFKSNPDKYLEKYGVLNTKVKRDYSGMLRNLPEVHVRDMFFGDIYVRYKPFN